MLLVDFKIPLIWLIGEEDAIRSQAQVSVHLSLGCSWELDSFGWVVKYNKRIQYVLSSLSLHCDACGLSIQTLYLNGETVIEETSIKVANTLSIFQSEGPQLGLELNIGKTKVFWLLVDAHISQNGLIPRHIGRAQFGIRCKNECEIYWEFC